MKKYTELVIITYPSSGESIAYRKADPELITALIELCNIEYDDLVICAQLEEDFVIEPIRAEERAFIESETKLIAPYKIKNGAQLRQLRKLYNLKQSDVAAFLDVTLTTLSRWENKHHKISKKYLPKLNYYFNNLNEQGEQEQ